MTFANVAMALMASAAFGALSAPLDRGVPATASKAAPFTFITIDARSEQALGEFPFDRAIIAKAVDKAAEMKARGVVLAFFLDKPRSEAGDRALMVSMSKLPVVLQACIAPADEKAGDKAGEPNPLPHRFELMRFGKSQPKAIGGNKGWIPLPDFCERAAAIGFVDSTGDVAKIPIIEAYQTVYVKTLHLICIEMAFNDGALITPGRNVQINDKSLDLDDQSIATIQWPTSDRLETISFVDFVNGKAPEAVIRDKILIIGVDTAKVPTVDTPLGKLNVHRVFALQLLALYAHFTK